MSEGKYLVQVVYLDPIEDRRSLVSFECESEEAAAAKVQTIIDHGFSTITEEWARLAVPPHRVLGCFWTLADFGETKREAIDRGQHDE